MNQQLTVVLPMFNRESQLRSSVLDVLELAHLISTPIEIVVVDDGSTDETYETACQLARTYPQVTVFRQSVQQGVTAAIEMVGRRLSVEMVVAHDGVTPVDASQLKALLLTDPQPQSSSLPSAMRETSADSSVGSRRFASVAVLHRSMEQAHRVATGFRWIQLDKPMVPRRRAVSTQPLPISGTTTQSIVSAGMMPTL